MPFPNPSQISFSTPDLLVNTSRHTTNATSWRITKLHSIEEDELQISGLAVDSQAVYFAVYLDGLYQISTKTNKVHCIISNKDLHNAEMSGIAGGKGGIYRCDLTNHQILFCALSAQVKQVAGNGKEGHKDGNAKDSMFSYPEAIATDTNGNLFVSEYGYVRKINLEEGKVETVAVLQRNSQRLGGLVVDKDGTIYGADYFNHCIYAIKNGVLSTLAGIAGKAGHLDGTLAQSRFSGPHGLACYQDGSLLVADKNGIRKVDISKNLVSTLVSGIHYLKDLSSLAIDQQGDIYVGTTDSIYKLENIWKWEKLLWIGHLKEHKTNCIFAALPKAVVHNIARHLRREDHNQTEIQIPTKRAKYF